jgi:SAM-dependent methyltransferase
VALVLILFLVTLAFAVAGLRGAPYVPIRSRDSGTTLDLAQLKPGQTLVDLGSGDGRLLRLAARRGIKGIGYDINPVMVAVASLLSLRERRLVRYHLADMWHLQLPLTDAIYVFQLPKYMPKLHSVLSAQIKHPTRVVSYEFEIPGAKQIARNRNTFVYQYGE